MILTIASSREGEGKSIAARRVARDIGRLGKRVRLVDTDRRRPTLHRMSGVEGKSRLTNVLTGAKSFYEVVIRSEIASLDYIAGFHRGAVKSALGRLGLINANIVGEVLNRFEPRPADSDDECYAYDYYSSSKNED